MSNETHHLPEPGVYRIIHYDFHGKPLLLTPQKDGNVTVFPAGTVAAFEQEWRLEIKDGKVAIQHRADIFPSGSLTYEGKPEAGKLIKLGPKHDFPSRVWNLEPALHIPVPGPFKPYFISTLDEDLRVFISPARIFPPQLILSDKHRRDFSTAWVFELVGK